MIFLQISTGWLMIILKISTGCFFLEISTGWFFLRFLGVDFSWYFYRLIFSILRWTTVHRYFILNIMPWEILTEDYSFVIEFWIYQTRNTVSRFVLSLLLKFVYSVFFIKLIRRKDNLIFDQTFDLHHQNVHYLTYFFKTHIFLFLLPTDLSHGPPPTHTF